MPKPISEYDLKDWSRLRPLSHRLKTMRYRTIDRRYTRQPPRGGSADAFAQSIRGKRALIAIAFDDPEAIAWQAQLVRRYVPDAMYLIADNTISNDRAVEIETIANKYDVPYIRLPETLWRQASRSHGLALNWMWRNVIRPGQPEAFGFVDDDLFPTAPDHPFEPLASQDFYDVVRQAGTRWYLWVGYCTFKFDKVQDKPLDFGQDWFAGLDTGGANWDALYCCVELTKLRIPQTTFFPYKEGVEIAQGPLQWCGSWLHEIGSSGDPELKADKRRVVAELLAPHLV